MPTKLYINTKAASPKTALVRSDTNFAPVQAPDLVAGDQVALELYLVDGAGAFDAASGSGSYTLKLAVGLPGSSPTSGTFKLTFGADTTADIAYNASAAAIQAALQAITSVGSGNCTVTGTFPVYLVEFISGKGLSNQAAIIGVPGGLSPASAVVVSTIREGSSGLINEQQQLRLTRQPAAFQSTWTPITNGWSGTIDTNTRGIVQMLGDATSISAVLEMELTTTATGARRTLLQAPILVLNEEIDEQSSIPTPLDSYNTATADNGLFVQNRQFVSGLTGGIAKLDGIVTVGIPVGWVIAVTLSGITYLYQLTAATTAEASPAIIRPDDYAGTTNEKVWKLIGLTVQSVAHDAGAAAFSGTANFAQAGVATSRVGTGLDGTSGNFNVERYVSGSFVDMALTIDNATGKISTNRGPVTVATFTQTASFAVTNTVTETSLFYTGVGTATLPANVLTVGKTTRLHLRGVWTNDAATTLTLKIKLGSTVIATLVSATALTPTLTNKHWQIDFDITCRTTGASGTVYGQGAFSFDVSGSANMKTYPANSTSVVTVDTTASKTISATVTWGTATSAVSMQADIATIEILN